jgi:hypothetical protein
MISTEIKRGRCSQEYAQWLEENVRPNVFAVATLKQSIVSSRHGSTHRVMGNPDRYCGAYRQSICQLSKRIYGNSNWRRHRRMIPSFMTLEGNGCGRWINHSTRSLSFLNATQPTGKKVRYHHNILFRRPDWIEANEFEGIFRSIWSKNEWALPDLFFEERDGNCVSYALKEGPETLDVMSLSF